MSHSIEDCKSCPVATDCKQRELVEESARLYHRGIPPHAGWVVHAYEDEALFQRRFDTSVQEYVRRYDDKGLHNFTAEVLAKMDLRGHCYRLQANRAVASCHADLVGHAFNSVLGAMQSLGRAMHSSLTPKCGVDELLHLVLNGPEDKAPPLKVQCDIPASKLH